MRLTARDCVQARSGTTLGRLSISGIICTPWRGQTPRWRTCGRQPIYSPAMPSVPSVTAAKYGGPIAMVRDSRKTVLVRGGPIQPTVRIFNCAGNESARFIWNGGTIVGMGWTANEQLLLVDTVGEIAMYDIHGQRTPTEFSLGVACAQEKLQDCLVYDDGVVGLTYENSIWAIPDLNDVRSQRLADIETDVTPQCMALRVSKAHGIEVPTPETFTWG